MERSKNIIYTVNYQATCRKICLNECFLSRLVSACPAMPKHQDRTAMAIAANTPREATNPAQKRVFLSAVGRLVYIYKFNDDNLLYYTNHRCKNAAMHTIVTLYSGDLLYYN